MTANPASPDTAALPEDHLKRAGKRPDFDMFDRPELPLLEPYPLPGDAEWLL